MMPVSPFLCAQHYEDIIGWFSYTLVVMESIGRCVNSLAVPRDCDVTFVFGSKLVHRFRVNRHTSTCLIFCSNFNEAFCIIVDIHDIHVHTEKQRSVNSICLYKRFTERAMKGDMLFKRLFGKFIFMLKPGTT